MQFVTHLLCGQKSGLSDCSKQGGVVALMFFFACLTVVVFNSTWLTESVAH